MPFTDSFHEFTNVLADKIQVAKNIGLSTEEIKRKADDVASYLAQNAEVKNPEQRVLKELWQSADASERDAIASALVRMVQRHQH